MIHVSAILWALLCIFTTQLIWSVSFHPSPLSPSIFFFISFPPPGENRRKPEMMGEGEGSLTTRWFIVPGSPFPIPHRLSLSTCSFHPSHHIYKGFLFFSRPFFGIKSLEKSSLLGLDEPQRNLGFSSKTAPNLRSKLHSGSCESQFVVFWYP